MTEKELAEMLRNNPDLALVTDGSLTTVEPRELYVAPSYSEHDMQVAIVQEAERRAISDPRYRLLFAVPNGGHRSKATAGKLKAEGVKRGVPDLCLPVPRAATRAHPAYNGLFMELKRKGNKPTGEQEYWIRTLKEQGYYACWVNTVAGALDILHWYLEGDIAS